MHSVMGSGSDPSQPGGGDDSKGDDDNPRTAFMEAPPPGAGVLSAAADAMSAMPMGSPAPPAGPVMHGAAARPHTLSGPFAPQGPPAGGGEVVRSPAATVFGSPMMFQPPPEAAMPQVAGTMMMPAIGDAPYQPPPRNPHAGTMIMELPPGGAPPPPTGTERGAMSGGMNTPGLPFQAAGAVSQPVQAHTMIRPSLEPPDSDNSGSRTMIGGPIMLGPNWAGGEPMVISAVIGNNSSPPAPEPVYELPMAMQARMAQAAIAKPIPKSKAPLIIGIILALGVVGAGVAFALGAFNGPQEEGEEDAAIPLPSAKASSETASASASSASDSDVSPSASTTTSATAAGVPASELDKTEGYLTVESSFDGDVFVNGVKAGKTNQKNKVKCGGRNVVMLRAADKTPRSKGDSVKIPCQDETTIKIEPTKEEAAPTTKPTAPKPPSSGTSTPKPPPTHSPTGQPTSRPAPSMRPTARPTATSKPKPD